MSQPDSLTPGTAAFYHRFPKKAPRRDKLPEGSEWMDCEEAAAVLSMSDKTVRRRAASGVLETAQRHGRTVVSRASVEALKVRQERGELPRDLRRLRGADRPSATWSDRYDDPYTARQTREAGT